MSSTVNAVMENLRISCDKALKTKLDYSEDVIKIALSLSMNSAKALQYLCLPKDNYNVIFKIRSVFFL